MKTGDILLTNKIEHRGFSSKDMKATFKCKPDTLMVYMFMGSVTPDSLPHFSPDGALAALGYGPIMATRVQRGLIEALHLAREQLGQLSANEGNLDSSLEQIDKALADAENFRAAGAPVMDPILLGAARFEALLGLLEKKIGADVALWSWLGEPAFESGGTDQRGRLLAIIDAATKK